MVISILQLVFGLKILIVSADFLLKKIIDIAKKTGVSPALITVTVVALGTSLPELITSLVAAFKDVPDISVGNVVGSNLFNILAVIGVSCLIRPLRNTFSSMQKEWGFLLLATILLWVLGRDILLSRWDGFFFLVVFLAFLYFIIQKKEDQQEQDNAPDGQYLTLKDGLVLCFSLACLLGGAHLALLGAIYLGQSFGMTERVIGLTIVSVGTGLPELAASVVAVFRKHYDISIANVIGSNVMNTLLITGIVALCKPLQVSQDIMVYDYWWLLGVTVGLFVISAMGIKIFPRILGLILIVCYSFYIYTLL